MKKVFLTTIIILLGIYASANPVNPSPDSLTVFSTADLYSLAVAWSDEYNRSETGPKIRVIMATEASAPELLRKGMSGFAGATSVIAEGSGWKMIVGRDVIVPVINSRNPFADQITGKGVSPARLVQCLNTRDDRTWGMLLNNEDNSKVDVYCTEDEILEKGISGYLGTDIAIDGWTGTKNDEELLSAVKSNPLAIGFCRLANLMLPAGTAIMDNISLMPIDRNSDGKIDHNEDIYHDLNTFIRGIWIGKYPSGLIRGIYSVSSEQPQDASMIAFLKWILDKGQQLLGDEGYTALLTTERQSETDKLSEIKLAPVAPSGSPSIFKTLLLVLAVLAAAAFLLDLAVRLISRHPVARAAGPAHQLVLHDESLELPKGLYFDKTHTWAFMEQEGLVRVGIDDFIHHVTGKIGRLKMRSEGEMVKRGEEILSVIRNGKQLNLYAPVSGIIRKRNDRLGNDADAVNTSPYGEGWVYMIEPANWTRESPLLMMADKHRQFIKDEITKLKDFLATAFAGRNMEPGIVILQDGGALADSPLADLSPEVWEEFQTRFIDPSRQVWFYELY